MSTALTSPQTIALKGNYIPMERKANAALSPGHLLNINSSNKFIKQAVAAKKPITMFALEKDYDAKEITVAYASDDTVKAGIFGAGHEVYARLAAAATAVVIGTHLESAGDGTLRVVTADSSTAIAIALEAVDNSAGGSEAFVRVVII